MTETQLAEFADQIMRAALRGDTETVDAIVEEIWELGYQGGKDALALDLWDGREVGENTVLFMIENNGVTDPRNN